MSNRHWIFSDAVIFLGLAIAILIWFEWSHVAKVAEHFFRGLAAIKG